MATANPTPARPAAEALHVERAQKRASLRGDIGTAVPQLAVAIDTLRWLLEKPGVLSVSPAYTRHHINEAIVRLSDAWAELGRA